MTQVKELLTFLNANQGLTTFVSTLLWGVYVYYTIETFRQIRKQTDLQMDASLLIESQLVDTDAVTIKCPSEAVSLYQKWNDIIRRLPNSEEIPTRQQYITLRLRNRGKSDIVSWEITVTTSVEPGEFLADRYNTSSESSIWKIVSQNSCNYICSSEDIVVSIAKTGIFPKATFSWTVSYIDSKGKKYRVFAGDSHKMDENLLVNMRVI